MFVTQRSFSPKSSQQGFTLIELVIVIIILGIVATAAAPKFINLQSDAKVNVLHGIAGQIESTTDMVKAKARVQGLVPVAEEPGMGPALQEYVVDFGFGKVEVDWRNLCPEAQGEVVDGDAAMTFRDFMNIDLTGGLKDSLDNQYYKIGYKLPLSGAPTNEGCYVVYDSFGKPDCTVTVVDAECR
ncbi:prepilin-type N-terminal cleavage/methylation domain-containing protein [Shewanella corallii]|uniref:prepilin-type N-terminal cleavage/methylation domain-containing protein n=1 Tax=Shewanella corallii TaxID=560080 RepID=UPI0024B3500A|nr:prepilin-type N-terminal cleavage/methylation domain-containing protein [Shewanella corallii]